jgi:dolichyl-diphosphooligosaccharide--protein glycosyltransferase
MTDNDKNEGISLDFSSLKKMFSSKAFKIGIFILMILIPVVLTAYIRIQPQYLPATYDWAQNSVYNYYKNNMAQQVNSQYPNLPQAQKDTLVNNQFNEFLKQNKDQLDAQIKQTSEYFKTGFQYTENGNNYTFLGDLDSYYYLRQARNLLNTGTVCDKIDNGRCIDSYILAPIGGGASPTMHPYGIVFLYKFLHAFNSKINLMQSAFYLPTVIAIIAAIAAFFIGRRLMNDVAGFFAAMFLAVSPLFLSRTLGSDTDVWNVMFPLLIIWIFIEAYEAKSQIKRYILSGLTGLFVGLFSFAWGGWWYVFDFMIVAVIGYIAFEVISDYIKHKSIKKISKDIIPNLLMLGIFIVSSAIFVSLFFNFSTFISGFTSPLQLAGTLKDAAKADLWPNIYTTVAELNEASIGTIIGQISFGMPFLFSLALLGTILMLIKKKPDFKEYLIIIGSLIIYAVLISNWGQSLSIFAYLALLIIPIAVALLLLLKNKDQSIDIKLSLILTIWFVGMIYASNKGVRFILLLVPAFSIALGVTLGYLYQYLPALFTDMIKIKKAIISQVIVFVLLCLILILPIQVGIATGKGFVPSMTRGWWDTLTKIREESKPDAIINSWWDFGHWFKYVADRRVTLDGVTQNHPDAYWLGRVLQTNNEQESIAILRMLDCGSNTFFDKINEKYKDTEESQNIVAKAIMMNKSDAITYLKELGFSNAEDIVQYSHCDPPEDYFITSEDMVGKAGVWAHFGLWDFDKAYIINDVRPKPLAEGVKLLEERFNYTADEATRIYYEVQSLQTDREMNDWIAPWPSYAGGLINCQNVSDTAVCKANIAIGNNGQTTTVIDRAIINVTKPENSQLIISFYDQTGRKLQETTGSFSELTIIDNTTKIFKSDNASVSLGILFSIDRSDNQTTYNAIIADPLLVDSTFTKLFFLDGKNMKHFEKFYDTTDITGSRIITWKVKW